ncbi:hypothetical protein SAMN04487761_1682 [Lachnospiraceae bacterium C7]|nr:hypothetical protein SAMN04487761_1682 [Lachnospiraceae bacterium C7]
MNNSNTKLIFFDIDGTLSGFDGKIPESTKKAINMARKEGHKLFVCTGRSRAQIDKKITDIGFDGFVCAAGAYVEYQGKEIYHSTFGEERMKFLMNFIKENNISFVIQSRDGCVISTESAKTFRKVFAERLDKLPTEDETDLTDIEEVVGNMSIDDLIEEDKEAFALKYKDSESLIYHTSPFTVEQMRQKVSKVGFKVTPSSFKEPDDYSGEITLESENKALGIQKVMEYFGLPKENTIAFGDGPNDLEMLAFVELGIAMGNGVKEAKECASYITDNIDKDGIYNAMIKFNLI